MTSLSAQYAWFADDDGSDSYCLTLVKDRAPAEVLTLLDGDHLRTVPNMTAVWHETQEVGDAGGVVAASTVANWTLLFEPFGYRGVIRDVAERLSTGTTLVSHLRTINLDTTFMWAEDGIVQAEFDLVAPENATGVRAGQLDDMLQRAGFEGPDGGEWGYDSNYLAAAMALADIITGVTLTAELLDDSAYLCATVPF
ncbi:DUF6461 domain-containing protein [Actinoplanes sp. NPDC051859]|uniref:DUF6461 domain-containing protein n=1 Tax=Actinoplanes sp. NPDC051859 TaxID=3363909 RepID=UPI0037ABDAA7